MARWMKPNEEPPVNLEAGDRIVMIVRERETCGSPLRSRVVILEATEDGWYSPDDTYAGYTIHDGYIYTTERDLCQISAIV